jgi:hypothetical protein
MFSRRRLLTSLFLIAGLGLSACSLVAQEAGTNGPPQMAGSENPSANSHQVEGLKLPEDRTVEPSEGFVRIVPETKGETIEWVVLGSQPVKYTEIGKVLILATPPGAVIHVYAITLVDGKLTKHARTVITVKGASEPVKPGPDPNPAPPLPAVTGPLFVLLIEDPLARAKYPYLTGIINNPALSNSIEKAGHKWRTLDNKDPIIQTNKLKPHIDSVGGVPCLLIMDKSGVIHHKSQSPRTPEELVKIVNRVAQGKKE